MGNISPLLMTRLIGQLTGAVRNLKMYDVSHPTSQKLFENSLQAIREAMGNESSFSFSLAGNILQINGKPVPDSRKEAIANFISELGKRSIGQLTFLQGIDRDQLQIFFEAMALDPEKLKDQGGLSRILQSRGVRSIQVKGISYGEEAAATSVATAQDLEALSQMPAQLLALIRSNPGAVIRMLTQDASGGQLSPAAISQLDAVAGTLSQGAGLSKSDYIVEVSNLIKGMEPALQQQVILGKMIDPNWAEILEDLLAKYSDDDILSLINLRLVNLKKQGFRGDWAEEVRLIWQGLPIEPRRKEALRTAFAQRLEQYGFSQDDRNYILGQEPPPGEMAEHLARQIEELPPDKVFSTTFTQTLLRAVRRGVSSPQLWQALWGKLALPDVQDRRAALQQAPRFFQALMDSGRTDLAEHYLQALSTRLLEEPDQGLLKIVIELLAQAHVQLVKEDKRSIAALASKALADVFPYLIDRPVVEDMLRALATMGDENAVRALIKGFNHPSRFEAIADILAGIGQPAVHWLLDTLRDSEDRDYRLKAMYVLTKIGSQAEKEAMKILSLEDRWFVRRNMALVLGQIGTEACLEELRKAFDDKDVRVRQEVLRAAAKIAGQKVEDLMIRGLMDKEPALKKMSIEYLGRYASEAGCDALIELYAKKDVLGRGEPPEIRMAIVEAAGAIGTKRAASLLMTAARDKESSISLRAQELLKPILKKLKEAAGQENF